MKRLNSFWAFPLLKLMKIQYGKGLRLHGVPVIAKSRKAKITIGKNVIINSSFLSNLIGLYSRTVVVANGKDVEITIGDGVGISGSTIYARKGIFIGERTLIGGNVKILDNDFHPLTVEGRREQMESPHLSSEKSMIPAKEVHIGKDCFIGCNSIILKGTVLGEGCVVGAGAVVSGEFPAYSVLAGNPARVLKSAREWSRE